MPNALSLLRLALIPVFVQVSLAGEFTAAFFIFVGAAATDALDGYIARRFNQRSRLGAYLDPAADKTMMLAAYVVYTIPGVARWSLPIWLTSTVFIRDITLVVFAYLLYTRIRITRFPPSIAGKISTIVQVGALAVTVGANTFLAPITIPLLPWIHRAALLITLYSGFDYVRKWDLALAK
ncbi:MAG TPA: CDP-alcohol phosphatidyltransferase family protein [Thermoanaerobaculia bacterium]|nr:CDP-alcohol phosphatidyltransferase family protein [Thermoanaerobaculia bacterium]